ncbi:endonuclease [Caerostris extrusa]|uniref:Endonuclease n=1 Tax=Caerostris extrusa TaxID=172846 RepID=A0AAV4TWF9_CAEEX|nr:endonuclease [Caerostris extrusa]
MGKRDRVTRIVRWALLSERLNYEITYRPGERMKIVDALSRYPEMKKQIYILHDAGIIQPSTSSYAAPVLLVKSQTGLFAFVGFNFGFSPNANEPSHAQLTGITTEFDLFQYKKLPFGLKNVGACFQRRMSIVLAGLKNSSLNYSKIALPLTRKIRSHLPCLHPPILDLKEALYLLLGYRYWPAPKKRNDGLDKGSRKIRIAKPMKWEPPNSKPSLDSSDLPNSQKNSLQLKVPKKKIVSKKIGMDEQLVDYADTGRQ